MKNILYCLGTSFASLGLWLYSMILSVIAFVGRILYYICLYTLSLLCFTVYYIVILPMIWIYEKVPK